MIRNISRISIAKWLTANPITTYSSQRIRDADELSHTELQDILGHPIEINPPKTPASKQ